MKRLLPAYPLFVKDPYFSLWANTEDIGGSDVIFWNGSTKKTVGLVSVGNKLYSFLGKWEGAEKLEVKDIRLTAFSTEFEFACSEFTLTAKFVSPLPPDDLEMLSCPVCYLDYNIIFTDAKTKEVCVSLSLSQDHCCDTKTHESILSDGYVGGIFCREKTNAAWIGLRKQSPLSCAGDSCSADWGYFYLEGGEAYYHTAVMMPTILKGGAKTYAPGDDKKYITALDRFNGQKEVKGILQIAFDDVVSINYYGDFLKGYYFRNGKNIFDALDYARSGYYAVIKADERYTKDIVNSSKIYGDGYGRLLYAALRQSVGAHKLVADNKGRVLFLSKECHSNGCIATVDVSYPSIPLYLKYNPQLVKGMMYPITDFAKMPVWRYDFSPHDAGCYPNCIGQAYGMNGCEVIDADVFPHGKVQGTFYPLYNFPANNDLYRFEWQMPVEECSNMLVMAYLYYKYDGEKDVEFLQDNYGLFEKWVKYLLEHGFIPADQLCTDDFAGTIGKNVNLSIKASAGIAAFAEISKALKKADVHNKMLSSAHDHADKLQKMYEKAEYSPLAMDLSEDTFSLKYNVAADIMMGTNLYKRDFLDKEIKCYLNKSNKYGVPLDSRKNYTKSDWILWTSTLASKSDAVKFIDPMVKFLEETTDRVPFSDWYDTVTGKQSGFQNRTVQGGLFILLLLGGN